MMRFKNIVILILIAVFFIVVFNSIPLFYNKIDKDILKVKITKGLDNKKNINITVTLPQIKREMAPVRIKELLSQTRVAKADQGGLELLDFKHDSLLARCGFKKGDIVKAINGQGVETAEDVVKACDDLEKDIFKNRDAKEIKVALNRDGEDIDMNFRIPEFVPEKVNYTLRLEKRSRR